MKRVIIGSILISFWTLVIIFKVRSLIFAQDYSGIWIFLGYSLIVEALLIWIIVAGSKPKNQTKRNDAENNIDDV